jgi:diketogulonate reductase-like aldo/keto reductase
METTAERDNLRYTKIPLTNGTGVIPALGFGTLIPDPIDTKKATTVALEAGFRQFDSAERYRNEKEVGEAMQKAISPTMGAARVLQQERYRAPSFCGVGS